MSQFPWLSIPVEFQGTREQSAITSHVDLGLFLNVTFLLPIMLSDVPWALGIQRERTPCRQQNEDSEGLAEGRREAGKKGQGLQTFVLLKGSNIPEEAVLTPGVWEKRNMTWLPLPKFVL